jgi:hypothetical protein
MFVHVEGGVQKRGGTLFVTPAFKEDNVIRLLPFDFTADQSYVMEFGEKYVRILTRDGVLLDPTNNVKNGNFDDGVTSWTATTTTLTVTDGVASLVGAGSVEQSFEDVKVDQVYKVGFSTTEGTAPTVTIIGTWDDSGTDKTDDLFTGLVDGATFTVTDAKYTKLTFRFIVTADCKIDTVSCTFVDRDYTVDSPYSSEQIQDVQFVQSADVVFMVHPDIRPKEFARGVDEYGNITWGFSDYEYDDGPYQTINTDDTYKLNASAVSGTATITATGFTPFTESSIGSSIRIKAGTNWGYGKITAYSSPTSVTVTVKEDFGNTTATDVFQMYAWSDENGWPGAVSMFEQRIIMGKTKLQPQGFWATLSGDLYTYKPTDETGQVLDESALSDIHLAGTHVSIISWIVGTQNLVFGTGGGLYRTNTTNSSPLAANTVRVMYDNGTQCADIQPVQLGTLILFTQRQRKKLFSAQYDFAADALVDDNVAQFAKHLIHSPIKEIILQREPNNILWVVLDDGTVRTCTYVPSQGVVAWHRFSLGGSFRGGKPLVESVTSISGYNEDNAWMVVRRTVNGQERRYIERVVEENNLGQEFVFHVDSGATIEEKWNINNITPGVDLMNIETTTAHGLTTDDKVKFYDIVVKADEEGNVGTSLNGMQFTVTVVDDTNFTVVTDPSLYDDYIEGGVVRKFINIITGLDHIEGQKVCVLADGAIRPVKTVQGGQIELLRPSAVTVVGLCFSAILSPVQYEASTTIAPTLQNKNVRNVKTTVQVLNSLGMKFGTRLDKLDIKSFRSTSDKMDTAVPLFTGKVEIKPSSNYSLEEKFYLVNDQPLPFVITSLVYELSVR